MLLLRPQLREGLVGGQRLEFDVLGGSGALRLEVGQFGLRRQELGLHLAFLAFESFQFVRVRRLRQVRGAEVGGPGG